MPESSTATCLGGRVVFLIDEAEALREHIAGGSKTKSESIATALNSLLNQLTSVPDLEVAVAGYRGEGNGAHVGCRWDGPLAGRRFVSTSALAAAPLTVETRVRRVPAMMAGGRDETVQFPVWYVPRLGDAVFPVLGYGYCRHLIASGLAAETAWSRPPLVISFVGDVLSQQVGYAARRCRDLLRRVEGRCCFTSIWAARNGAGRCSTRPATYTCPRASLATSSAGQARCRSI